jgi:hypothetical protein
MRFQQLGAARVIHLTRDAHGLTWAEIEEVMKPGDVIGMDISAGVEPIDGRAWESAARGNFEEARLIQSAAAAGLIRAGGANASEAWNTTAGPQTCHDSASGLTDVTSGQSETRSGCGEGNAEANHPSIAEANAAGKI